MVRYLISASDQCFHLTGGTGSMCEPNATTIFGWHLSNLCAILLILIWLLATRCAGSMFVNEDIPGMNKPKEQSLVCAASSCFVMLSHCDHRVTIRYGIHDGDVHSEQLRAMHLEMRCPLVYSKPFPLTTGKSAKHVIATCQPVFDNDRSFMTPSTSLHVVQALAHAPE